jgi:ADP-ribosyl-[dinitrogen reductase] hydrolase
MAEQSDMDPLLPYAQGAILGALLGDAIGAFLEFGGMPTSEKVDRALTLPGGGHWGVSPGQVTDDGEMTLSQLRGILDAFQRVEQEGGSGESGQGGQGTGEAKHSVAPESELHPQDAVEPEDVQHPPVQPPTDGSETTDHEPQRSSTSPPPPTQTPTVSPETGSVKKQLKDLIAEGIARRYCLWSQSLPFDMGNATFAAFGWAQKKQPSHLRGCAKLCTQRAATVNNRTQANGALMRMTPLSVFSVTFSLTDDIRAVIQADCGLSHPNPIVVDCCFIYAVLISHLVLHPGDRAGAIEKALAQKLKTKEVASWLSDGLAGKNLQPAHPQAGWIKIAFMHALHQFSLGASYESAIRAIISLGGDTDTNACIAGGLLGALHGVNGLPQELLSKVEACDTTERILRQRPKEFRPTKSIRTEISQLFFGAMKLKHKNE